MDAKTARVFEGIRSLTPSQEYDLLASWRRYKNGSSYEQKRLNEHIRVVLGPTSGACACCGK